MNNKWLKELTDEYVQMRAKSISDSWLSWPNIQKRFSLRKKMREMSYQELKEYDYDFSYGAEELICSKISGFELSKEEIEKGVRALRQHISRSGERWGFLVGYASVFAISVLLIKAGIIPYPILSLIGVSLLALLVLEERTKHLNSKHAVEELVIYLEAVVVNLEKGEE